ncbi:hypothetical protein JCM10212_006672 [Sporobolomyces blumeae]
MESLAEPERARHGESPRLDELGESSATSPASTSEPAQPELSRSQRIQLAADIGDLNLLRVMAGERGGFESTELRKLAWPVLLGCDRKGKRKASGQVDLCGDDLPPRDDERQVRLDIARSLIHYPQDVSESERDVLRGQLERAILFVLRKHPALQYFQGYHDIVSILLLTFGDEAVLRDAVEQMSLHRIRDSMGPGLEPTLGYLKLVHRLIQRVDPDLYFLVNQAATMPFFALSWALTLFSHDLSEVAVIARLFDFLLAHNPAMISYLVVAILLTKKADLVDCLAREGNDPATVHSVLSQLPNLTLAETTVEPPAEIPSASPPSTPPSTSISKLGPLDPNYTSGAESENLLSSPSASMTSSSFDLSSSTSSALDVSESLVSLSELASPTSPVESSGARRRATRSERFSTSSFDSDIHAFDDSMLSDPDIDNPAFSPFPTSRDGNRSTPSPPSTPQVGRNESPSRRSDEVGLVPKRTVLVEDVITSALDLWHRFPLVPVATDFVDSLASSIDSSRRARDALADSGVTTSSQGEDDEDVSLGADSVLGPNSCVFTYSASLSGALDDAEAERICAEGVRIVHLEALLPDEGEGDEEAEESGGETEGEEDEEVEDADEDEPGEDEDGFEIVEGSPEDPSGLRNRRHRRHPPRGGGTGLGGSSDKRKKNKKGRRGASGSGSSSRRRSSQLARSSILSSAAQRINLGPHGWLVVGGVAVATAVAFSVYQGRAIAGPGTPGAAAPPGGGANGGTGSGASFGIGTGGLGLRTGGFGLAGAAGGGPPGSGVPPAGPGSGAGLVNGVKPAVGLGDKAAEGAGSVLKSWAKGAAEL